MRDATSWMNVPGPRLPVIDSSVLVLVLIQFMRSRCRQYRADPHFGFVLRALPFILLVTVYG